MKKYNNASAFIGYRINFKWNGIYYYKYVPYAIYFKNICLYSNYDCNLSIVI